MECVLMNINVEKTNAINETNFFAKTGQSQKNIIDNNLKSDEIGFYYNRDNTSINKSRYSNYDKSGIEKENNKKEEKYNTDILSEMSKEEMQAFLQDAVNTLNNLVTEEDYSKFSTLGIIADKEDMTTIVTVYERIQIQLAAYGDSEMVSGLHISNEKIEKIMGSQGLANAVKKAESIGNIDDSAKEYILKNNLEPTVDNVYMSVHATEGQGSILKEMTEDEWKQLEPQIEKILEKNGLEISKDYIDDAKWLLERDLELSPENIIKLDKLNKIDGSSPDGDDVSRDMAGIKANMILAELFMEKPGNAYMTEGWINKDEAANAVEMIALADEDVVDYIEKNDLRLNVANISMVINNSKILIGNNNSANNYLSNNESANKSETNESNNRKEKYLEIIKQAKNILTLEGAIQMQKMGVNIVYDDLEEITSVAYQLEKNYEQVFFDEPDEEKTGMLKDVMSVMAQMSHLPVAAIGVVAEDDVPFNVQNIYEAGNTLRERYAKAEETYEAVGTQIRSDLGDSIGKAFRNTDELIKAAGLKPDDNNRRAVRILGYNNMEINRENIIHIEEKALEFDKVIKNITPKTAAYLIEKNINPLTEDIEELNDRLEIINETIGADENEEYSKYLWKLQKSGDISLEEREAYIELFRSLKAIKKMDTRAVGAVVNEGAEFTLGNLLQAELSKKIRGKSVTVDDNTGYYQGRMIKDKLGEILKNIHKTPEVSNHLQDIPEINLEVLAQEMTGADSIKDGERLEALYKIENLKEFLGQMGITSEETISNILEDGLAPNLENMSAMAKLMMKGEKARNDIKEKYNVQSKILDNFTEEDIDNAYEDILNEVTADTKEDIDRNAGEDIVDVNELRMGRNAINMASYLVKAAREKNYYVPMDIGGEDVLVKVRFIHENNEGSHSVKISLKDDKTGSVEVGINIRENKIDSYIKTDVKKIEEGFYRWSETLDTEVNYTGKMLYDLSKSILKGLKDWA